MSGFSRREWLQKSLLASSSLLIGSRALSFPSKTSELAEKYAFNEILKLNWNENPYGPSANVLAAATEALAKTNLYPDSEIEKLVKDIATQIGVQQSEIMLTCGSTEVLSLLGQHVGLVKGEVVTPWPTFPTLLMFAETAGGSAKHVELTEDQLVDLDAVYASIGPNTRMVFICNPNNPTSTEVSPEDLRRFCRKVPANVMICVDEAYIEYSRGGADSSVVSLISELPNLVVSRTFSKGYGLAGIRIGYAVSQHMNIDQLRERHNGFGMGTSMSSVVAAQAAIKDQDFLMSSVKKNEEARQILYAAFDKWGVAYNRSSTNFVYANESHFVTDVVGKLQQKDVLITKWPIMEGHIRISLGTPDQMKKFTTVMESFLI